MEIAAPCGPLCEVEELLKDLLDKLLCCSLSSSSFFALSAIFSFHRGLQTFHLMSKEHAIFYSKEILTNHKVKVDIPGQFL